MANPSNYSDAMPLTGGTVAVFTQISALVLRSFDPVRVAQLLNKRERYEIEIESKRLEFPSLKPVRPTASIDRSLLRSLIYMGDLETFAFGATAKTVTDQQLEMYIKSVSARDGSDYEPSVITSALKELKYPTDISNAPARITTYCAKFFYIPESVGYEDFRDENPKQTAQLLLQKVQPTALITKMFQRIKYDRSLEKNAPALI